MDSKYTDFGLEVRAELLKQGKNMSWLAEQVGCSVSFLSDMFRGNRKAQSIRSDWKTRIRGVLYDEDRRKEATKSN